MRRETSEQHFSWNEATGRAWDKTQANSRLPAEWKSCFCLRGRFLLLMLDITSGTTERETLNSAYPQHDEDFFTRVFQLHAWASLLSWPVHFECGRKHCKVPSRNWTSKEKPTWTRNTTHHPCSPSTGSLFLYSSTQSSLCWSHDPNLSLANPCFKNSRQFFPCQDASWSEGESVVRGTASYSLSLLRGSESFILPSGKSPLPDPFGWQLLCIMPSPLPWESERIFSPLIPLVALPDWGLAKGRCPEVPQNLPFAKPPIFLRQLLFL